MVFWRLGWPACHRQLPPQTGHPSPVLKPLTEQTSSTAATELGAIKPWWHHPTARRQPGRGARHFVASQPPPNFLLCSPHRRPGPRAGLTLTTSPSGRAAWTLSPAGLAICRWSTLRWGSTLSSLKTRSPSWERSTETLNDSEERCRGGRATPSPAWSQTVPRHGRTRKRRAAPGGARLRTASPAWQASVAHD